MMAALETRNIIVGITGPIGSGVSTVASVLEQRMNFKRIKLSQPIVDELIRIEGKSAEKIENIRPKLQDLGNKGRRENRAKHYWIERALSPSLIGEADVVIERIRNIGEIEYLRSKYRWFFVIAVDAPRETRWDRVKSHYEYHQDESLFNKDDERDTDEGDEFGQQVDRCVSASDYVFLNHSRTGHLAYIYDRILENIKDDIAVMKGSRTRPAYPEEFNMATAYAQSFGSQCLKRNVGAVIVDQNNIPLSLGFNENPTSTLPCVSLYQACFKDRDMFMKLERMKSRHCPKCGMAQEQLKEPWKCAQCQTDLKREFFPSRNMELCTAIHAEERAIRSLPSGRADNGTMYVTTCPCFQCARYIIESGIKKVKYVEAYPVKESVDFLAHHRVVIEPFKGFKSRAFATLFKGAE